MAVAYHMLIIVPVLPAGGLEARRNPILGDARSNMYTVSEVVERLALPDSEEFRLSVRSMEVRAGGMDMDQLVFLSGIMVQFTNVHTLNMYGVNSPMYIRLNELPCTTFNMHESTARCRVRLGNVVTHAKLDANAEIEEQVVPSQMVRLDFTAHADHVVPLDTSLQSMKVGSLVPRQLRVPQRRIRYEVGSQVALQFYGDAPFTTVRIRDDSDEAPPPVRRRLVPLRVERVDSNDSDATDVITGNLMNVLTRLVVLRTRPAMRPSVHFQVEATETVCSACLDEMEVGSNGFKAYPCDHPICEGCNGRRGEMSMRRCPLCASSH